MSYNVLNSIAFAHQHLQYLKDHPEDDYIPTCFENLNDALSGGLTSGLYVIGAISSLGKTTFCLQMADNLSSNNDVLYFSLEQSQTELIAKSLKRESYKHSFHDDYPNSALFKGARYASLTNNQKKAIENAYIRYSQKCKNMYFFDNLQFNTIEEILEITVNHLKQTGKKPILFIDYLQFLHTKENIKDTKRELDTIIQILKRFIKQNNITVFLISSFNRASYKQNVDMTSFAGSGGIEFTADVLIGMQPKSFHDADEKDNGTLDVNINEEKNKDVREIEMVILKNRHGQCGNSIYFSYLPKYSIYQELYETEFEEENEDDKYDNRKSKLLGV